jgi:hypothetical protein
MRTRIAWRIAWRKAEIAISGNFHRRRVVLDRHSDTHPELVSVGASMWSLGDITGYCERHRAAHRVMHMYTWEDHIP